VDLRAPVPSHWLEQTEAQGFGVLVGFDVAAPSRSATGRASALATAVKQSLGVVVRFDEAAPGPNNALPWAEIFTAS
jgi:hypothetical protein